MKLAEIIDRELKNRKVRSLKAASQLIGISAEIIRAILVKDHIPKDRTLRAIAQSLELDLSLLVIVAHQQKLPGDVKGQFLVPDNYRGRNGKSRRKAPLSQEQCDYLKQEIGTDEIQLVRKYRQLSDEGKIQSRGYIDYIYSTARKTNNSAKGDAAASSGISQNSGKGQIGNPGLESTGTSELDKI
ncbi:MAG: hypothetical protein OEW15_11245 [Nitrospirota bacterium]|nr:hypothetical protein [Nitrospirota bacterium]